MIYTKFNPLTDDEFISLARVEATTDMEKELLQRFEACRDELLLWENGADESEEDEAVEFCTEEE